MAIDLCLLLGLPIARFFPTGCFTRDQADGSTASSQQIESLPKKYKGDKLNDHTPGQNSLRIAIQSGRLSDAS